MRHISQKKQHLSLVVTYFFDTSLKAHPLIVMYQNCEIFKANQRISRWTLLDHCLLRSIPDLVTVEVRRLTLAIGF